MTVLIANDISRRARGLLKRWFIEPKPNVFVGTVNRRTREKVIALIRKDCPDCGLLAVCSSNNCQGFSIDIVGEPNRRPASLSGLFLVAEKWCGKDPEGI